MMKHLLFIGLFATSAFAATSPVDTLHFSHRSHLVDIGAACDDCHAATALRTSVDAPRSVTEQTCKKCHDGQTASFDCIVCHSNAKAAKAAKPTRVDIKFSHVNHVKRVSGCTACHPGLDKKDKADRSVFPEMETCFGCHDNRKASRSCLLCHADLHSIKPVTHTVQWLGRGGHGYEARMNGAECRECHQDNWCSQCHRGNTETKIHVPGYQFEHGMDVKRKEVNCTVCHETRAFCARCHEGKR